MFLFVEMISIPYAMASVWTLLISKVTRRKQTTYQVTGHRIVHFWIRQKENL